MDGEFDHIVAKGLTIVDSKGHQRISMSFHQSSKGEEYPCISLFDKRGCQRIAITIEDHPIISICHEDGSGAVGMAGTPDEGGAIGVNDSNGKRAVEISAGGTFGRCVIVFGEDGVSTGSLPTEQSPPK